MSSELLVSSSDGTPSRHFTFARRAETDSDKPSIFHAKSPRMPCWILLMGTQAGLLEKSRCCCISIVLGSRGDRQKIICDGTFRLASSSRQHRLRLRLSPDPKIVAARVGGFLMVPDLVLLSQLQLLLLRSRLAYCSRQHENTISSENGSKVSMYRYSTRLVFFKAPVARVVSCTLSS